MNKTLEKLAGRPKPASWLDNVGISMGSFVLRPVPEGEDTGVLRWYGDAGLEVGRRALGVVGAVADGVASIPTVGLVSGLRMASDLAVARATNEPPYPSKEIVRNSVKADSHAEDPDVEIEFHEYWQQWAASAEGRAGKFLSGIFAGLRHDVEPEAPAANSALVPYDPYDILTYHGNSSEGDS